MHCTSPFPFRMLSSCRSQILTRLFHTHSGMVIDQARKGGFRFRTIDEIAEHHVTEKGEEPRPPARRETESDLDKKTSEEFVEAV